MRERTSAGHTAWRVRLPGAVGDLSLGTLTIAFQYESIGDERTSIEAIPIQLTVSIPHTFGNRTTYDAELVSAAIGSLRNSRPSQPEGQVPALDMMHV